MTNERMQWSEAEAVVMAYYAQRRRANKPRFVDQSGRLSAALAAVVTVVLGGGYLAATTMRGGTKLSVAVATSPVRAVIAPISPIPAQSAVVEQKIFIGSDHRPIRIHLFKQFSEPL